MIRLNQIIERLQNIVKLNSEFGELPVIFEVSGEGDMYNFIYNFPALTQVHDIKSYNLELVGFYQEGDEDSISLEDVNCVIIN